MSLLASFLATETVTKLAAELTSEELCRQGANKLFRGQFDLSPDEWVSVGMGAGMRAALVLILLTLAWTLAGWASNMVRMSLQRLKFDETLTLFMAKLAKWAVLLLAGIACLSKFGVETASFAAVIGATGFAIGLAFQGTLSNFASGAMLLVFRPYKVGDVVEIADKKGVVDEIELFTTTIDTFDNRRIIIPNSEIYGSVIENITYHASRRIDVEVGVSYAADIDETRRILTEAANATSGTSVDPEPAIVLSGLGASSVDWSIRVWGPTSDYLSIKQSLLREVKMGLDQANIEIPFPQMDVHLSNNDGNIAM